MQELIIAIATIATIATIAAFVAFGLLLYSRRSLHALQARFQEQEQKTAEFKKKTALERSTLLDAVGDALFLINSKGLIVLANRKARALLQNRDLVGRSVSSVFLNERLANAITEGLSSPKDSTKTIVLSPQGSQALRSPQDNGETAWEIDTAALEGVGDNIAARVLVRDITIAHQTEQIRKDFVANASHELRTPLAIIQGYLENLLEDETLLDDKETSQRFLTIMSKHSDRISRIVEDMLVISRLESGAVNTLTPSEFSISGCVNDVTERLESVIRTANADVNVSITPTDFILNADRFYLTQVLFNLIENAIKQNPDRSVEIAVSAHLHENNATISITDNGIGIPSADLPHIFRRFYRVQKDHSQGHIKGTGLGLSIVKRAIEAHNGTIEVASAPGIATTFTIQLPQ